VRDQIVQVLREEALWAGRFLVLPDTSGHTREAPDLSGMREAMGDCQQCSLCRTRKTIVFGEGDTHAELMFIGEAPGAAEDETGRPFVGPAGNLLTKIIENAMGLKRKDVYIANILKCRPPGNRDPLPEEVQQCIGYLESQIDAIRPKVIVTLGRIATQYLLKTKTPISRLRGTFQEYMGIAVMPTYHPSYLLQNPSKKRDVWEDIKKVMAYLHMPRPQ
jgi:uracil-DNA glycosylase family 4